MFESSQTSTQDCCEIRGSRFRSSWSGHRWWRGTRRDPKVHQKHSSGDGEGAVTELVTAETKPEVIHLTADIQTSEPDQPLAVPTANQYEIIGSLANKLHVSNGPFSTMQVCDFDIYFPRKLIFIILH